MPISQLDLVLLGDRGLTARIGGLEGAIRAMATGPWSGGASSTAASLVRANLLLNSSFEFYNRNAAGPQDWTVSGSAILNASAEDGDGQVTMTLHSGASLNQTLISGSPFAAGAFVLSVAVKAVTTGQSVGLTLTHSAGVEYGVVKRLDATGGVTDGADVPADGQWYRFYVQGRLVGGASVAVSIASTGSGDIEVDAAKFEYDNSSSSYIEPTAYQGSDWGSSTIVRNLKADNIVAGTLTVGGSGTDAPVISVKDGSDAEIVTIGEPSDGYYGVEVKGTAGLRISGTGSAEVIGGGSVKVKGGGDITVDGGNVLVTNGNVQVTGTGKVFAGTAGAARTEMAAGGIASYGPDNVLLGSISAADGRWTIDADALTISGTAVFDAVQVTGALNLGQDFSVGPNVFFVDQSQSNVGINRTPDPQFDLDVAGNLRSGGFIVGKHALQVTGATMICHFDGPEPPTTDFTGNLGGHRGQQPDTTVSTGGLIFRPGKFGKGVQLAEYTENIVLNPSAEVDVTNVVPNSGMVDVYRVTTEALYGAASFQLQPTSRGSDYWVTWEHAAEVYGTTTYVASMYVKGTPGDTVRLNVFDGNSDIQGELETLTGEWQRIQTQVTTTYPAPSYIKPKLWLYPDPANPHPVFVDAVQLEASYSATPHASPYCDGSLGTGHSWAGTPHASKSIREQTTLAYRQKGVYAPTRGSVSMWLTTTSPGADYADIYSDDEGVDGSITVSYDNTTHTLGLGIIANNAWLSVKKLNVAFQAGQSYHLVWTWDSVAGMVHLYVNGVKEDTTDFTSANPWTPAVSGTGYVYLGGTTGIVFPPNGVLDDLAFFGRVLSGDEVRAIYESDAPIFAETSTWAWRTPNNLAWADSEGLWATTDTGVAAFGVSGVTGKSWGLQTLDPGDVLIGSGTSYVLWDASAAAVKISGQLVVGDASNKLWLNDANDGGLAVGGTNKANAPFRVSKAGALFFSGGGVVIDGSGLTAGGVVRLNGNGLRLDYPNQYDVERFVSWNSAFTGTLGLRLGMKWNSDGMGGGYNTDHLEAVDTFYIKQTNSLKNLEISNNTAKIVLHGPNNRVEITNDLVAWSNIYLGTRGAWLASWLDQGVTTASSPTFGNVYISGVGWVWGDITNQAVKTTSGPTFNTVYTSNWFRSTASGSGWLNTYHGGGWYMYDTWIRNYNAHPVWIGGGTTQLQLQSQQCRLTFASDSNGYNVTEYYDGTNFNWYSSGANVNVMSLSSGSGWANVGIRKDGPGYMLEVGANSAAKPSSNVWTVTSDGRTKKDVQPHTDGLAALKALPKPVKFKYNGEYGTPEDDEGVGWVAQDIAKVRPGWVKHSKQKPTKKDKDGKIVKKADGLPEVDLTAPDEDVLGLNSGEHIYILHNAILELAAQVEALQAKVNALTA